VNVTSLTDRFAVAETYQPGPDDAPDIRPMITVRAGELPAMAFQGETALILGGAPFYVRGGAIMKPVVDNLPSSSGTPVKAARLLQVSESAMIDHLARVADWEKFDGRKQKMTAADPPAAVASTIMSRDGEWRFSRLAGVITTPTMRPDGTILAEAGYDEATQLLLLDPPKLPAIPDQPTKEDAAAALLMLDSLLSDFPFVDAVSRAVALSALITPVVRGAMPVSPMHAVTATTAGSGKSYIVDLASAISGGERAPVISVGSKGEETEKRLHAAVLEGHPLIAIDNVNGELGGDFLCQMIERPIVSIRPLGSSVMKKVESRACCFATGNNIKLVGDMTRRVLLCSLDPNMERPELREFKANPFEAVIADRPGYIAAALVIVRAYASAGYPGALSSVASFEGWSRLVRSALVWLGQPDPVMSMEKARDEDPITLALTSLLTAWRPVVGSDPKTVGEIIAIADLPEPYGNAARSEFRQALNEAAPEKLGKFSSAAVGKYLGRHAGRVVAGLKLVAVRDNHTKQNRWQVTEVA
jgi:putative DNA primase/helicase